MTVKTIVVPLSHGRSSSIFISQSLKDCPTRHALVTQLSLSQKDGICMHANIAKIVNISFANEKL